MLLNRIALRLYNVPKDSAVAPELKISAGAPQLTYQARLPYLVKEPVVLMVLHDKDYTYYNFYEESFSNEDGILLVLAVDAEYKLPADYTPYDILLKAYRIYKEQKKTNNFGVQAFLQYLSEIHVEERAYGAILPLMTGKEPASFRAETLAQAAAILRFSNYKQLMKVACLEIGFNCDTTIPLPVSRGKATIKSSSVDTSLKQALSNQSTDESIPLGKPIVVSDSDSITIPLDKDVDISTSSVLLSDNGGTVVDDTDMNPKKGGNGKWVGAFLLFAIFAIAGATYYVMSSDKEKTEEFKAQSLEDSYNFCIKLIDEGLDLDEIKVTQDYLCLDEYRQLCIDSIAFSKEMEKKEVAARQKAEEEAKMEVEEENAANKAKDKLVEQKSNVDEKANLHVVLQYVNGNIDLSEIRTKPEYQALSPGIRVTIESVVDYRKYNNLSKRAQRKITLIRMRKFKSFDDMKEAQGDIQKIVTMDKMINN